VFVTILFGHEPTVLLLLLLLQGLTFELNK
jgi:hypothetical protein